METQRLKIKVGDNEFEAEGPPEVVNAQFEAWKSLVASAPPPPPSDPAKDDKSKDETNGGASEVNPDLPSIYSVDERKKTVTLAVLPQGGQRDADGMLLLLYGYRAKYDLEDVMVGKLKESMAISGRRLDRIDRTIQPHIRSGYVLKGGQGKGGKYRLTNTGIAKAKELIAGLT